MKRLLLLTVSCAAIVAGLTGCTEITEISPADTILVNGKIYAGSVDSPWLTSVAIEGNEFVYAGDDTTAYVGPDTKTIDLAGRLVVPGLIDAHSHPALVALSVGNVVIDDASTKEELLAAVRKMVAENPDRDVLLGGFWSNEIFDVMGPHKRDLDEIESERPVILYDYWAQSAWANSAALEQAGVTAATEDLVPGFSFYQKDEDGEPTGWITESATSVFVNKFQTITPDVESELLDYLNYYRDVGVTTVLDAGNFGLDRDVYAAVSRLDKQGLLPVRYHGAYTLFIPDDMPAAVETLKKLGEDFNSDKVRIDTLKIFFDGVLETRTAALSDDYLDTPGNSGEALLGQQQVHDLIVDLDAEGLNLHVHTVGDRAVTTILDAVQDAHDTLSRSPVIRIALCHLEVVKEADIARFKELGVIANFTPHWFVGGDDEWYTRGIGDVADNMQRAGSFVRAGGTVTFSSDITDISELRADRASPYLGIQLGHNRQDVGVGSDGPLFGLLNERVSLDELVDGYTTNAAYQLGREDEFGTIAAGQRADFVVLDSDIFSADRYEIHNAKPVAVVVDGEVVSGDL